MPRTGPLRNNFARALREVRLALGMQQEAFDLISSRVYISSLERGLKQPTLGKVDDLAAAMDVHPLALLVASYCRALTDEEVESVLANVREDLRELAQATRGRE